MNPTEAPDGRPGRCAAGLLTDGSASFGAFPPIVGQWPDTPIRRTPQLQWWARAGITPASITLGSPFSPLPGVHAIRFAPPTIGAAGGNCQHSGPGPYIRPIPRGKCLGPLFSQSLWERNFPTLSQGEHGTSLTKSWPAATPTAPAIPGRGSQEAPSAWSSGAESPRVATSAPGGSTALPERHWPWTTAVIPRR